MKFFSYTNAIILGLITVILILAYYQTIKTTGADIALVTACKESVRINALTRYDTISADTDIKCPTVYAKVKSTNRDEVFKLAAQSLSYTWNEFHEGRVEVFNTEKENFCVVRRVLEFSESARYEGFLDYLLQHNPPNIQKSYFSYVTNIDVEEGKRTLLQNPSLKNSDVLDTATPYAAVFFMAKKPNVGKIEGAILGLKVGFIIGAISPALLLTGPTVGAVTGFILGSDYATNWNAGMMFIPYTNESLKTLNCSILPVAVTENLAQR